MPKKGKGKRRGRGAAAGVVPGVKEEPPRPQPTAEAVPGAKEEPPRPQPTAEAVPGAKEEPPRPTAEAVPGAKEEPPRPQPTAAAVPIGDKPTAASDSHGARPRVKTARVTRENEPELTKPSAIASGRDTMPISEAGTAILLEEDKQTSHSPKVEMQQPEAEVQSPRTELHPSPPTEMLPSTTIVSTLSDVTRDVAELSLKVQKSRPELRMASRPGIGTYGKLIDLVANYFVLGFKDFKIYHYDVDIIPLGKRGVGGKSLMEEGITAKEAAKKKISHLQHQQRRNIGKKKCREIIAEMIKSNTQLQKYKPAYDGQKNLYTRKPLPITKKSSFTVSIQEDVVKDFQVIVQAVEKEAGMGNIISLEPLWQMYDDRTRDVPQEIVMALDTIFCHRDPPFTQLSVGRSFFNLDGGNVEVLGEGYEIWFGYNQSIHLTQKGPAIVINASAKAFHTPGSVLIRASHVLRKDITKLPLLDGRDVKKLTECLSKVKVQVNHLPYPRKYLVKSVTIEAAKDKMFELEEDGKKRKTTVARYFAEKYRRLEYPNLPCLHMKTNTNTTFIPLECCDIFEGQPVLGELDKKVTEKMIKRTAVKPQDRFDSIGEYARAVSNISGEQMNHFGLQMNLRPIELKGRVITAPELQYLDKNVRPDNKGTWRSDERSFLKSGAVARWVIISFAKESYCSLDTIWNFANSLCEVGRGRGLILSRPLDVQIFGDRCTTRNALLHAKKFDPQLVVAILSRGDAHHSYEELKFIADIQLRMITQCMDGYVVAARLNNQVLNNVCLKINSKLGGINHALLQKPVILNKPVIIIGADVAHSLRGSVCPSIAALVGSLDSYPSKYTVTCSVLDRKEGKQSQEIISKIDEMMINILETFRENTKGKIPEKIIFYRDGVSEGQFSQVLNEEVFLIQKACAERFNGYIPLLTFVVVQKNHQTRLKPRNPRDGIGRMGNIPPGTTVDTDITHPVYFDFFIASHEGIQGTSKPAHYTVLFDQNEFSANAIYQLSYHLCHTYVRCNRSISIPAPVMYAHLAAARAKKYCDLHLRRVSESSNGSGGASRLPQEALDAVNNMKNYTAGMFFI